MLTVDIVKRLPGFKLSVQFEAEDGVTALLGASGCGKSLTLRCIAGVLAPDEGYIGRDGQALFDKKRRIDLPPQKRRVGLMFQHYALFPHMTLLENAETGLHAEKNRALRRARAMKLMEGFGLAQLSARYPHELSGGQQQRAALCRILAGEPRTLLLDEPFTALDSHLKRQLERETAAALGRFSGVTLLVTHDRGEAYRLSSRACVMDAGENEPAVPTEELFRAPRTKRAALLSGFENVAAMERLGTHTLRVPAWDAQLETAREIPPGARYVALRARSLRFGPPEDGNVLWATPEQAAPELFSCAYTCRTGGGGRLTVEQDRDASAPPMGERACISLPRDAIILVE